MFTFFFLKLFVLRSDVEIGATLQFETNDEESISLQMLHVRCKEKFQFCISNVAMYRKLIRLFSSNINQSQLLQRNISFTGNCSHCRQISGQCVCAAATAMTLWQFYCLHCKVIWLNESVCHKFFCHPLFLFSLTIENPIEWDFCV